MLVLRRLFSAACLAPREFAATEVDSECPQNGPNYRDTTLGYSFFRRGERPVLSPVSRSARNRRQEPAITILGYELLLVRYARTLANPDRTAMLINKRRFSSTL
jgi:hypothetical protein